MWVNVAIAQALATFYMTYARKLPCRPVRNPLWRPDILAEQTIQFVICDGQSLEFLAVLHHDVTKPYATGLTEAFPFVYVMTSSNGNIFRVTGPL